MTVGLQLGPKILKYVAKTLLQCLLALFVCVLQKNTFGKNAMTKTFSLAFAIWLCRPQPVRHCFCISDLF